MATRLEEFLLESRKITGQQLGEALQYQATHGGGLSGVLVGLGILKDEEVDASACRRPVLGVQADTARPFARRLP